METNITSLDLGGNGIGDEGISVLSLLLPSTPIVKLDVGNNSISDIGVAALAACLRDTCVKYRARSCSCTHNYYTTRHEFESNWGRRACHTYSMDNDLPPQAYSFTQTLFIMRLNLYNYCVIQNQKLNSVNYLDEISRRRGFTRLYSHTCHLLHLVTTRQPCITLLVFARSVHNQAMTHELSPPLPGAQHLPLTLGCGLSVFFQRSRYSVNLTSPSPNLILDAVQQQANQQL